MKVSIVTISYNQSRFLEEAILSVINQEYPQIEYIVVDPGSTDGSREIIEKYRGQIDQIILEPDNGPSDGLNKGFKHASGQIYGYLNSDDRLRENAISKIVDAFKNMPNTTVVSGHGYIIDIEGNIQRKVFSHRFNLRDYAYGACTLVQQASFFRGEAFWNVGGFNVENKVNWDGELWVDLALAGAKFGRIQDYLADFRIYESSITGSGAFSDEYIRQHERIFKKIGINPNNCFKKRLFWAINRLTDPRATIVRFIDGVGVGYLNNSKE
jgi:glycosyltransferase involved in cell wall biosynthesis